MIVFTSPLVDGASFEYFDWQTVSFKYRGTPEKKTLLKNWDLFRATYQYEHQERSWNSHMQSIGKSSKFCPSRKTSQCTYPQA